MAIFLAFFIASISLIFLAKTYHFSKVYPGQSSMN